jgi:hypothetical protein
MAHTYIITEAYVLGDNGYVNGTVDGTAVSVTCPTLQFQSLPTPATKLALVLALMLAAVPPVRQDVPALLGTYNV